MKAVIITPCLKENIKSIVDIQSGDFVICADNSFNTAIAQGIIPDLIIGDFDTGAPIVFPDNTEVIRFPVEKDDSDTMLCIKEAVHRGFTSITVAGGISGRLDHTFANIQTLAYGKSIGADITFADGENEMLLMNPGKLTLAKKEGCSLSVFSYGDRANGITLTGVKYPLTDGELTNLFPLGLSNEITAEHAEISFDEGKLLIICSRLN
jgi:thiamine pyrophosphokinase